MTAFGRGFRILLLLLAVWPLTGCAGLTHYNFRRSDLSGAGDVVFADAKQRAVLSAPQPAKTIALLQGLRDDSIARSNQALTAATEASQRNDKNLTDAWIKESKYFRSYANKIGDLIITGNFASSDLSYVTMCAEPSPDALSAIAASGGLAGEIFGKGEGQIQGAIAESAGNIGLRTQSIQLMRDSMYRLCEGYMNGALGNAAFETLHRRFQNSMVAILAIEQLTGVVRPPTVVLSSTASVGAAENVEELTDKTNAARTSAGEAKDESEAAKSKVKADTQKRDKAAQDVKDQEEKIRLAEAEQKKSITGDDGKPKDGAVKKPSDAEIEALKNELAPKKEALTAAESNLKEAEEDAESKEESAQAEQEKFEYLDEARKAALFGRASASATGFYERATTQNAMMNKDTAKHVSEAVKGIVDSFYGQSYIDEVCTTLVTSMIEGRLSNQAFAELSKAFLFDYDQYGNVVRRSVVRELREGEANLIGLCKIHIAAEARRVQNEAVEETKRAKVVSADAKEQTELAISMLKAARRVIELADKGKHEADQQQRNANNATAAAVDAVAVAKPILKDIVQDSAIGAASSTLVIDACEAYRKSGVLGVFKNQSAKEQCNEAQWDLRRQVDKAEASRIDALRTQMEARQSLQRAEELLRELSPASDFHENPDAGRPVVTPKAGKEEKIDDGSGQSEVKEVPSKMDEPSKEGPEGKE